MGRHKRHVRDGKRNQGPRPAADRPAGDAPGPALPALNWADRARLAVASVLLAAWLAFLFLVAIGR